MNNFLKISVSLFALTLFYSCSDSNTIQTKLEVDGGQIEGMAKGSLKQYLGIPYAAPPVGELRLVSSSTIKSMEWCQRCFCK